MGGLVLLNNRDCSRSWRYLTKTSLLLRPLHMRRKWPSNAELWQTASMWLVSVCDFFNEQNDELINPTWWLEIFWKPESQCFDWDSDTSAGLIHSHSHWLDWLFLFPSRVIDSNTNSACFDTHTVLAHVWGFFATVWPASGPITEGEITIKGCAGGTRPGPSLERETEDGLSSDRNRFSERARERERERGEYESAYIFQQGHFHDASALPQTVRKVCAHSHTQLRVRSHSGANVEWLRNQTVLEMALFAFQIWCNLQNLSSIADVLEEPINFHFILENSQKSWPMTSAVLFFWPFMALWIRQPRDAGKLDGGGADVQQGATGRTQTLGCCSRNEASVNETPALPTELMDAPCKRCSIKLFFIKIN